MKNDETDKILLIPVFVIILLIAASVYLRFTVFNPKENVKLEFSRDAWENSPEKRFLMIDDMLVKYNFIGMSRDAVIDLLGKEYLSYGYYEITYQTFGGFMSDEDIILNSMKSARLLIFIFLISTRWMLSPV